MCPTAPANSIYWTRHPIRLAKGETLLTDGGHLARARCGNRISDSPNEPTNAIEPEESELDTPELPDAGFAEAPPIHLIAPADLFVAPNLLSLAAATPAPVREPLPGSSSFLLGASPAGSLARIARAPAMAAGGSFPDAEIDLRTLPDLAPVVFRSP